jgi:hypothetical protein
MADEPIKPSEQKIEPKKDTVRITLPPKIGTAAGADARPAGTLPTPTVKLPTPPSITAAKAQEQAPLAKKESDTKTIPGGKKRETQTIKTDTSKVKTSPTPGAAIRAAAATAAATPAPPAPRPTTVRLPSPAEVQQVAARQPIAPPAPVGRPIQAVPGWVTAVVTLVAIAALATGAMLFLQYQSLGQ